VEKLLVVDDDPHVVNALCRPLLGTGHQVLTCPTEAETQDRLQDRAIRLLVIDLLLHYPQCIPNLRVLRSNHPELVIVATSEPGVSPDHERAFERAQDLGIPWLAVKPVDPDELAQDLMRLIQSRGAPVRDLAVITPLAAPR